VFGFLKGLFGKADKNDSQPTQRISQAPIQTQDEQDATRNRMQAEMDASRGTRRAKEGDKPAP
jgi:hypothetical protein